MFWGFQKICGMVEVLLILFIQKTEKHLQTKSPQLLCYRLGELTLYKVCVFLANEGHSQYSKWLSLATISQPFYSVNSLLITHSSDRSRGKPELKPGGVVGGSISKSRTESDQSGNFFCRLRMYNSLKEVSCYLYFC